ncbi:MAG TPA: M28 family peptidase [Bacteroidales bacterium]|nr:M28 family peptidase [Bacteroidales bacterium]
MKRNFPKVMFFLMLGLICTEPATFSQLRGLGTISKKELKYNLDFLGAVEFRGRETPSPELEIATLYLGNWAGHIGLKPVMKDGSFYQPVPVTVASVFQPGTRITLTGANGDRIYYFGKELNGNFNRSGTYRGEVVFAGLGISDPETGWDDLKNLDLRGKIVVILDAQRPGTVFPLGFTMTGRLMSRIFELRNRGAAAVLSVVSPERERKKAGGQNIFDYIPEGRMTPVYETQRINLGQAAAGQAAEEKTRPSLPFERAEISHDLAADMLGITKDEIAGMFSKIEQGLQVPSFVVSGISARLDVEVETFRSESRNVLAMVEGSDPVLKNEYIVISGHHDARGIDDGAIIAGADDNGSACVALMEIGRALLVERPKRSVILAWFTGEEQGMNGSHYFVNNCPVPVEKISVCLNMDMISRNDPDSLYLVGSDLLSSELDASIRKVNKKYGINFTFDYLYSNLTHPQRVYFRSDQYPFVRLGIPSVWFFCGFTYDYHTEWDIIERVDYDKLYKTTRLVYLTAYDIGNMKHLVRLDVNPAVTSRGKHNLPEKSLFGGR